MSQEESRNIDLDEFMASISEDSNPNTVSSENKSKKDLFIEKIKNNKKLILFTAFMAFLCFAFGTYAYVKNQATMQQYRESKISNQNPVVADLRHRAITPYEKQVIDTYNTDVVESRQREGKLENEIAYERVELSSLGNEVAIMGGTFDEAKVGIDQKTFDRLDPDTQKAIALAIKNGCRANDTQCWIKAGIIKEGDCAPMDIEGLANRVANKTGIDTSLLKGLTSDQLSQIEKLDSQDLHRLEQALRAGCKPDDSDCWRANGIISKDECAALDKNCLAQKSDNLQGIDPTLLEKIDSHLLKKITTLNPKDAEIIRRAIEAGCQPNDTQCMRLNGIITKDECSPLDDICIASRDEQIHGINQALLKNLTKNEIDAIGKLSASQIKLVEQGLKSGCKPSDTACFRLAGLIESDECAPLDLSCSNSSNNNLDKIDPRYRGLLTSDQVSSLAGLGEEQLKLVSKALELGCAPDDTACWVLAGLIRKNECAPMDKACSQRAIDQSNPYSSSRGSTVNGDINNRLRNDPAHIERLRRMFTELNTKDSTQSQDLHGTDVVYQSKSQKEVSTKIQTANAINDSSNSIALDSQNESDQLLIKAGQIEFGINQFALSNKLPSEVKIEFVSAQNQLAGSYLLGTSSSVDEYLKVELKRLVLEDGRTCTVSAKAMDLESTYLALQSDIDRHTLFRYGFWGLGTVLKAAGAGMKAFTDTETIITNGTVIQSVESTTRRGIGEGVSELGNELGAVFRSRLDTPPTVTVKIHEQVGIYFDQPVKLSNCIE